MGSTEDLFTHTLRDITLTKLSELAQKRDTFEEQRSHLPYGVQSQSDDLRKLTALVEGVKACFNLSVSRGRVVRGATRNYRLELDLRNLDRFLALARYDPSVTTRYLVRWQESMYRHLDVQSAKFQYASLYGELTNEWLSAKQTGITAVGGVDTDVEDFEHIDASKKMESRLNWERSVFEPASVNKAALIAMLNELFEPTAGGSKAILKALNALRENVEAFEAGLAEDKENFNIDSLGWVINGLLSSDLLTDEKRVVLREFKSNNVILKEVADVLNMRMTAIQSWSWGSEVPLEERRQLNGNYNIYMHEDLLQAIFLQYIGVAWSVFWKGALSKLYWFKDESTESRSSNAFADRKRRNYFLGPIPKRPNVNSTKRQFYRGRYFLASLLDSKTQESVGEEGDEEANFDEMAMQQPQASVAVQGLPQKRTKQTARRQLASKSARKTHYSDTEAEIDNESDPGEGNYSGEPKNPMQAKQALLHLLSTEILLKCRLQGEITCFRSQIDDLFPSLPHDTIESILSFFGVSKKWLEFFQTFLKAPLRFIDEMDTESRVRQRGTPGSHVLSEVFGEIVLFCLDFKVHQESVDEHLWRMQDDFWFWSPNHNDCVKSWSSISQIVKIMGLSLNKYRTGSVRMAQEKGSEKKTALDVGDSLPPGQIRWGMLYLNADTGRFEIDQKMVDQHVDELNRQLKSKTNSIFAWIQAWNSYAATFFTSNFGKAANCFGREHVDNMLATHKRIQEKIFSSSVNAAGFDAGNRSGNIVEFLKQTLAQRFGVKDIPDGYFFFPTELGGLEVRNPFIGLLQIRDTVLERPEQLLDDFEDAEKEAYLMAKSRFESGHLHDQHPELRDSRYKPKGLPDTFFSFEEYTKHREDFNYGFNNGLVDVFTRLLGRPGEESPENDQYGKISSEVNVLSLTNPGAKGITSNWYSMEPYWKWVAQLYGPEMIDKFGGLSIVDPGLLPMGMVGLFRSGRVKWQE